jgi:hypothetical protein
MPRARAPPPPPLPARCTRCALTDASSRAGLPTRTDVAAPLTAQFFRLDDRTNEVRATPARMGGEGAGRAQGRTAEDSKKLCTTPIHEVRRNLYHHLSYEAGVCPGGARARDGKRGARARRGRRDEENDDLTV